MSPLYQLLSSALPRTINSWYPGDNTSVIAYYDINNDNSNLVTYYKTCISRNINLRAVHAINPTFNCCCYIKVNNNNKLISIIENKHGDPHLKEAI